MYYLSYFVVENEQKGAGNLLNEKGKTETIEEANWCFAKEHAELRFD